MVALGYTVETADRERGLDRSRVGDPPARILANHGSVCGMCVCWRGSDSVSRMHTLPICVFASLTACALYSQRSLLYWGTPEQESGHGLLDSSVFECASDTSHPVVFGGCSRTIRCASLPSRRAAWHGPHLVRDFGKLRHARLRFLSGAYVARARHRRLSDV